VQQTYHESNTLDKKDQQNNMIRRFNWLEA